MRAFFDKVQVMVRDSFFCHFVLLFPEQGGNLVQFLLLCEGARGLAVCIRQIGICPLVKEVDHEITIALEYGKV